MTTVDRTDPQHARCQCGHVVAQHQQVTRYVPTMVRGRGGMRSSIRPVKGREDCLECDCRRPR